MAELGSIRRDVDNMIDAITKVNKLRAFLYNVRSSVQNKRLMHPCREIVVCVSVSAMREIDPSLIAVVKVEGARLVVDYELIGFGYLIRVLDDPQLFPPPPIAPINWEIDASKYGAWEIESNRALHSPEPERRPLGPMFPRRLKRR